MNIFNIFITTVSLIHPYYLFCSLQNHHISQNIAYTPENICGNFGGFLNNQCIDYFNKHISESNVNTCNQFINDPDYYEIANKEWTPFINFLYNHKKYYDSFSTVLDRLEIFNDNLAYVDNHNMFGNSTYTLGATQFADMTNEEYVQYIRQNNKYDVGSNIYNLPEYYILVNFNNWD